jgi:hypothetical protein
VAFSFSRPKAPNKYGAIESKDGTRGFSSKLESAVHAKLFKRQLDGEISNIKCQQTVVLQGGPRETRITWRIDFSFEKDGITHYCEAKGFPTREYKMKLKIWRYNPPAPLEIWGGNYTNPKLIEKIEMKEITQRSE